jgi:hypothetical protein
MGLPKGTADVDVVVVVVVAVVDDSTTLGEFDDDDDAENWELEVTRWSAIGDGTMGGVKDSATTIPKIKSVDGKIGMNMTNVQVPDPRKKETTNKEDVCACFCCLDRSYAEMDTYRKSGNYVPAIGVVWVKDWHPGLSRYKYQG